MRVGDKLYCIDGTVAVLQHFDDNLIVVEYNGTLHVRPRSVINQRLFFEPTKLKIISDDHVSIDDSVLNIIDVRLAKGLEFDTVYVIDSDMTENEKNVSYTRALSHLSILSN